MSAVSGRPVSVASARPAAEASVQPAHTEPVSAGAAASAKGQAVTPTLDHEIAPAPKKPVARAKSPVCFTISYSDSHRKPGTAAGDDETWLRQRVQVALNHDFAHVAAQSICVKVGGVAVKFKVVLPKGKTKPSGPVQLSLAPVRPNAKLAVSYCVAKNFCHEECKIPKDEFMDAFSAAAGGLGEGGSGGWNDEKKPPSKDEKELHDEVSGLEKDLLGGGANEEVYRGWTKGAVTPFCEM